MLGQWNSPHFILFVRIRILSFLSASAFYPFCPHPHFIPFVRIRILFVRPSVRPSACPSACPSVRIRVLSQPDCKFHFHTWFIGSEFGSRMWLAICKNMSTGLGNKHYCKLIIARIPIISLGADYLIFEGGGGGGGLVGRFRKKISCNPRRKKKNHAAYYREKNISCKRERSKKNSNS